MEEPVAPSWMKRSRPAMQASTASGGGGTKWALPGRVPRQFCGAGSPGASPPPSQELGGRRGSNPALNVCAYYGVCRKLNTCSELQPLAIAPLDAEIGQFQLSSPTISPLSTILVGPLRAQLCASLLVVNCRLACPVGIPIRGVEFRRRNERANNAVIVARVSVVQDVQLESKPV